MAPGTFALFARRATKHRGECPMGGKAVDIEEKIPWYRAFPLGLQHFLSMFGATVLVPTLMGFSPSVSVMCSGIGTALLCFGARYWGTA